jgi:hypothetical protein
LINRGTVNLFNREFTLLTSEQQKSYFTYDAEKIKDNQALFSGGEGPGGMMPDITITAKVDIENQEAQKDGSSTTKQVRILSRLKGILGSLDKERALTTSFYSFTEDKTKTPSEFVPASYSDQEIKVMLLPDFLKSLTGISKGSESAVNTNAIIADYVSSRLQTWAFRSLEREFEKRLGVDSLTLEYNFGKDVRQALGVTEVRTIDKEKPDWRVGFAKRLFDQLYIDMRYSQYAKVESSTDVSQIFNYQLTYKLTPIWSIIYYREPVSLQDLTSGNQKVTLKAGAAFW